MEPEDPPLADGDARALRWLRSLVTVLTLTMIGGIVVLVALFWLRLPPAGGAAPLLPDTLELPPGASLRAVTRGEGWWALVVADAEGGGERILIYGADGTLRRSVPVEGR